MTISIAMEGAFLNAEQQAPVSTYTILDDAWEEHDTTFNGLNGATRLVRFLRRMTMSCIVAKHGPGIYDVRFGICIQPKGFRKTVSRYSIVPTWDSASDKSAKAS